MIDKWDSVINLSATENKRRKKYSFTERFELPDSFAPWWRHHGSRDFGNKQQQHKGLLQVPIRQQRNFGKCI